ncbi:hypothetical protein MRX96_018204 [Rhipicephalus microplus]
MTARVLPRMSLTTPADIARRASIAIAPWPGTPWHAMRKRSPLHLYLFAPPRQPTATTYSSSGTETTPSPGPAPSGTAHRVQQELQVTETVSRPRGRRGGKSSTSTPSSSTGSVYSTSATGSPSASRSTASSTPDNTATTSNSGYTTPRPLPSDPGPPTPVLPDQSTSGETTVTPGTSAYPTISPDSSTSRSSSPSSSLRERTDDPGEAVNDDDAPDVPVDDPAMDMPPDNTALLAQQVQSLRATLRNPPTQDSWAICDQAWTQAVTIATEAVRLPPVVPGRSPRSINPENATDLQRSYRRNRRRAVRLILESPPRSCDIPLQELQDHWGSTWSHPTADTTTLFQRPVAPEPQARARQARAESSPERTGDAEASAPLDASLKTTWERGRSETEASAARGVPTNDPRERRRREAAHGRARQSGTGPRPHPMHAATGREPRAAARGAGDASSKVAKGGQSSAPDRLAGVVMDADRVGPVSVSVVSAPEDADAELTEADAPRVSSFTPEDAALPLALETDSPSRRQERGPLAVVRGVIFGVRTCRREVVSPDLGEGAPDDWLSAALATVSTDEPRAAAA